MWIQSLRTLNAPIACREQLWTCKQGSCYGCLDMCAQKPVQNLIEDCFVRDIYFFVHPCAKLIRRLRFVRDNCSSSHPCTLEHNTCLYMWCRHRAEQRLVRGCSCARNTAPAIQIYAHVHANTHASWTKTGVWMQTAQETRLQQFTFAHTSMQTRVQAEQRLVCGCNTRRKHGSFAESQLWPQLSEPHHQRKAPTHRAGRRPRRDICQGKAFGNSFVLKVWLFCAAWRDACASSDQNSCVTPSVGQNRVWNTPYMTVYLVISCQNYRICTVYIWSWPTLVQTKQDSVEVRLKRLNLTAVDFNLVFNRFPPLKWLQPRSGWLQPPQPHFNCVFMCRNCS